MSTYATFRYGPPGRSAVAIDTATSLKMQNPLARSGWAWWSPPPGANARARDPDAIDSNPANVAPTIRAAATSQPGNEGVSPPSSSPRPGFAAMARTNSRYSAVWNLASTASSAGSTTRRASSQPAALRSASIAWAASAR
jgi:hypothetical protein